MTRAHVDEARRKREETAASALVVYMVKGRTCFFRCVISELKKIETESTKMSEYVADHKSSTTSGRKEVETRQVWKWRRMARWKWQSQRRQQQVRYPLYLMTAVGSARGFAFKGSTVPFYALFAFQGRLSLLCLFWAIPAFPCTECGLHGGCLTSCKRGCGVCKYQLKYYSV